MATETFFGFNSYHVAMATMGGGIILAYWIPRFFSGREPAASGLLILLGMAAFALVPGMPEQIDPRSAPRFWELTSELAVIVALFGSGIRIDNLSSYARWRPTVRLLVIVMPLTIAAVALLGWGLGGMTLASALLLGAVLAPTDPVLAGDVQVGPPTEGGEHPARFALTTEAGLNDGLAFPFVYLALIVAAQGFAPQEWGLEWVARDLVYRIAVGAAAGAAAGWLLGKILFALPKGNRLADTGAGVVALAGILFCYGAAEMVEGYGFIAVFVAGLTLRRVEADHRFHGQLHGFSEAVEHSLTALLLVLIGGAFPLLWPGLDWRHIFLSLALILVVRPLFGWLSLIGTSLNGRERLVVAAYGVRGIGSIYYLAYAVTHARFADADQLWGIVAFTILASTLIHGLTAGFAVEQVTDGGESGGEAETPAPRPEGASG